MSEIKSSPEVEQQQIFSEVIQRLTRAGVSPEIIRQLDEAMDFAVHKLQFAIDFSVLRDQPTSVQERLLLLAAIARRWKNEDSGFTEQKQLAILISHLILPHERTETFFWERIGESEDESLQSLEVTRYNHIAIHYAYLRMSLAPQDIETVLATFLTDTPAVQQAKFIALQASARDHGNAILTRDHGVNIWEINLNLKQSDVEKLEAIFKQHGYAFIIANAMRSGKLSDEEMIMYAGKNPTPTRREHELNHVRYHGLAEEFFGTGIDEAVTEYLAQETVKKRNDGFSLRKLLGRVSTATTDKAPSERIAYRTEIDVLLALCKQEPSLMDSIITRYKKANLDTSTQMMAGLLNTIGIDGLLDLYRMSPRKNSTMSLLSAQEFRSLYFP